MEPSMRTQTIFDDGVRRWVVFGRDPSRAQQVIDTNQYLVLHEGKGMLLDPGGVEIFPPFVASLTAEVALSDVESIFASHQDPDVISSLSLWRAVRPDIACYASWCWSGFITHFGGGLAPTPIPDEGGPLPLGSSRDLRSIPAHYCHSSGNLHVWDPRAKILFSGDMGAALVPNGAPLFVEDFGEHVKHMEGFHKRWMPSNRAKNAWVKRARALNPELIAPQHGSIFRGADVGRFLDWIEGLQVGSAVP
jgi:flavorubredoxin